jgi:hypothetical protein
MSIDDPDTSPNNGSLVPPDLQTQASNDFGQATDQAKRDLDAVARRAAHDAREIGQQAKERVGEATEKAKSFAGDQKDLAAGQINGVAEAITKVADELDGSDQQTVARYARDLAAGLSRMGKTIESKDVDDLMGVAQDFGRRQPVAFLGAAVLLGFVASRFSLASAHRRESRPSPPANLGSIGSDTTYGSNEPGQTPMGGL